MGAREPGLSAGETADILGVDAAWVTARIDGGELRATHHRGSHPSRPMPDRHRISGRDLQVFLMGHAHGLDGSHVDLLRFIMIMAVRNPGRRKSPHRRQGPAGADPGPAPYRRWTRTPHQAADRGMYGLNWSEGNEIGCGPWWRPAPPTRRRACWGGTSTRCASRPVGWAWNGASTRGLSGLCDSRGLAHPARQQARGLDGPDSGTAAGPGSGGPQGNDRGGAV